MFYTVQCFNLILLPWACSSHALHSRNNLNNQNLTKHLKHWITYTKHLKLANLKVPMKVRTANPEKKIVASLFKFGYWSALFIFGLWFLLWWFSILGILRFPSIWVHKKMTEYNMTQIMPLHVNWFSLKALSNQRVAFFSKGCPFSPFILRSHSTVRLIPGGFLPGFDETCIFVINNSFCVQFVDDTTCTQHANKHWHRDCGIYANFLMPTVDLFSQGYFAVKFICIGGGQGSLKERLVWSRLALLHINFGIAPSSVAVLRGFCDIQIAPITSNEE